MQEAQASLVGVRKIERCQQAASILADTATVAFNPSHGLMFYCFLLLIFLGAFSGTLRGDTEVSIRESLKLPEVGQSQIIYLTDGSSIIGRVVSVEQDSVSLETGIGLISIAINKIREVKTVAASSLKNGTYWFPNPNRTRLYVAATARMLRRGESYFTDIYLFFPGVAVGVTDNVTIGGGITLFPGIPLDEQLLYLTPKIGIQTGDQYALSVSALIVRVPFIDDPDLVGVLFGTGTIGSEDRSLTFGLGYGFADGELADKPAVLLGGEFRAARRVSFVSENWLFPGADTPLVSYGLRFFGESLSVDLAFINVLTEDAIFPGVPFVGFVYNF